MDDRENMPAAAIAHDSSRVVVNNIEMNYNQSMKMMEYARLRSLVPSVASRSRVSKIQVIEEAIKYIALLQRALRTQPRSQIQEVAHQNTTSSTTQTQPKTVRAKRQRIASYMIKPERHSPKSRPKFSKSTTKKRTKFLRI